VVKGLTQSLEQQSAIADKLNQDLEKLKIGSSAES